VADGLSVGRSTDRTGRKEGRGIRRGLSIHSVDRPFRAWIKPYREVPSGPAPGFEPVIRGVGRNRLVVAMMVDLVRL